jgi:hypothetical protein
MYFAARQYPELRTMAKTQQLRFVAGAIRADNRWIGRRFMIAFWIVVFSSGSVAWLPESMGIPDWGGTAVAVVGGLFFYAYMLWELNGPLLHAVKAHVAVAQRPNSEA